VYVNDSNTIALNLGNQPLNKGLRLIDEYKTLIVLKQSNSIKSKMEELIKQQQQMREYELNSLQTQRENIVIHNEQNVSVHPDIDETKSKKVTWSDESTLEKDVEIMKSQIAELYALVQQLQNTTKEE
jgi:translation initiation factor 6 (eIF-6)